MARVSIWHGLISSMAREMFWWPNMRRIEVAWLLQATSRHGRGPWRVRQVSSRGVPSRTGG